MVWNKIIKQFKILKAVAFVTYKEWAAYRSHILISLFVEPVFFLVQLFIWKAIYAGKTVINGLTFSEMLLYYGVGSVMGFLIMDFADWNLQMLIRTGQYVTFMLRPLSHRFYAFSQKVGHRILGFWMEFIPVFLIFFFLFNIKLIPKDIPLTLISLIFSFIINFLINYTIGITGFWLTKAEGMRRIIFLFKSIAAGTFIPLTFFPDSVQTIFFFLPFQYITYVPISVFLGHYKLAGIELSLPMVVTLQGIMLFAVYGICTLIMKLGVKRFTAVGV